MIMELDLVGDQGGDEELADLLVEGEAQQQQQDNRLAPRTDQIRKGDGTGLRMVWSGA